jgi:hypothetical protein
MTALFMSVKIALKLPCSFTLLTRCTSTARISFIVTPVETLGTSKDGHPLMCNSGFLLRSADFDAADGSVRVTEIDIAPANPWISGSFQKPKTVDFLESRNRAEFAGPR